MIKRGKTSISTSIYSKAFLVKAWENRGDLLDYERRGFAQFFYLTICGHIEHVLVGQIKSHLFQLHHTPWETANTISTNTNGNLTQLPIEPVASSIRHIASRIESKTDSAPLSSLIQLYADIFPTPLTELIGKELDQDLLALAKLRNIFAHGRDIFMEFVGEGEDFLGQKGTFDDNPLKFPAQRLQAAGIIVNFDITPINHHDFTSIFFGDSAMLHFYEVVRQSESRLKAHSKATNLGIYAAEDLPELTT